MHHSLWPDGTTPLVFVLGLIIGPALARYLCVLRNGHRAQRWLIAGALLGVIAGWLAGPFANGVTIQLPSWLTVPALVCLVWMTLDRGRGAWTRAVTRGLIALLAFVIGATAWCVWYGACEAWRLRSKASAWTHMHWRGTTAVGGVVASIMASLAWRLGFHVPSAWLALVSAKLLILVWVTGVVIAAVVFVYQMAAYRRSRDSFIDLGGAIWLGSGQIAILFGALMVSFGAPDVGSAFDLPAWLVVVVNHAANIGGCIGCGLAAVRGGVPRHMPWILAAAGAAVAGPAFLHGAFVLVTVAALLAFGALATYGVLSVHTHVLARVPTTHRGAAMGLVLSFCLAPGVGIVGVPLLGGWRLGLVAIGVVFVTLALTFRLWQHAPKSTSPQWRRLRTIVAEAWPHRRLIGGVAGNFAGWVALYTLPSLAGASSDTVVILAVVGQLIAAALTPWAGRLADRHRRTVGITAACLLAAALLGTAIAPALAVLAIPLLSTTLGWWIVGVCFSAGEVAGNVNQGVMEAELSLSAEDSAREQRIGLALRFLTVGLVNIALASLTGLLQTRVSGSTMGEVIGAVCAAAVLGGVAWPMRKLSPPSPDHEPKAAHTNSPEHR